MVTVVEGDDGFNNCEYNYNDGSDKLIMINSNDYNNKCN